MSQSGALPKQSEISMPSPRSEIINTQKTKMDSSNPNIYLMNTLISEEDESDINTNTGVIKMTLLSSLIESMIITKERKSEYQQHSTAGKESILPPEMDAGQKHLSEKMTISFQKGIYENKSDTSEAISSGEDSWKDPLGEISEESSIEILTGQKFLFAEFILPAKELLLLQRVYKNPNTKHSNIKELVTEHYQEEDDEEATWIKSCGSMLE
ncbi:hypothetical protein BY996DRAFT_6423414 [Phakopsora pachyrhizi]|nr:hypothetical protein BY996DRAFT_6423414 [Phakopsora pachyrhizi]